MKSRLLRILLTNIFRILIPAAFFAYVFHVIKIRDVLVAFDGVVIGGYLLAAFVLVRKIEVVYCFLGGVASSLTCRRPFFHLGAVIARRLDIFMGQMGHAFARNVSPKLLLLSSVIVVLRYLFILAMVRSMGAPLSLGLVTFLFAFLYAAKLVQGVGSFGSQEAGIAAALMLFGMSQVEALPVAIGTHLLQWALVLGFGILGYVGFHLHGPREEMV